MNRNLHICHHCPDCQAQPKNGGCLGPCKCLINGRDIHQIADEGSCPVGKHSKIGIIVDRIIRFFAPKPPKPKTAEDLWRERGPLLWSELHRWPLHGEIARPLLWLSKYTEKLGCGRCGADWKKWMVDNPPPDVASNEALFRWTVDAHNAVNQRLGKPTMEVDEARKRWS